MIDIMADIETLSVKSNAAIMAIGAVKFDPVARQIIDRFYSRVDPQSCIDVGLAVDSSTIQWWLKQSEEARSQFYDKLPPLRDALNGFAYWLRSDDKLDKKISYRVWGNGATFDNVILTNAYKSMGMERPWDYMGDRCYRTIKSLFPQIRPRDYGTAHRADHDAEAQALHLMDIWPYMFSEKKPQEPFYPQTIRHAIP